MYVDDIAPLSLYFNFYRTYSINLHYVSRSKMSLIFGRPSLKDSMLSIIYECLWTMIFGPVNHVMLMFTVVIDYCECLQCFFAHLVRYALEICV